ncbi:hypothetical protein ABKY54_004167 [Vibrio harveyi]
MTSQKSLLSSIISVIVSIKLTGLLQLLILVFGVIAGFYALKRNRAECKLSEYKLAEKEKGL